MEFTLKVSELDNFARKSAGSSNKLKSLLVQTMTKATTLVQNDAKRIKTGSFKNQTGNLRRSIYKNVESGYKGRVATDEAYATYVEKGTKPHTITPKNKKLLAFKIDNRVVFARRVNHPGSKPYPFMEPALLDNIDGILNEYKMLAQLVLEDMAGNE